jgi:transposase
MRFIGLDVHRDFCEVAICLAGERARSAGRVSTEPEKLRLFAQSLDPRDRVVMESTGNALAIARILDGHVAEVTLANPMQVRAISHAKVKSDRFDARTLAELFQAGVLPTVWVGDERTRCLRRLTSRRSQLVRARTRTKNEISAVLIRNLAGRPPASDLFGKRGRAWLAELELPGDERQTVDACLRQVDFLTGEIAAVDRQLAGEALDCPEIKRLMTIPGVDITTAATLTAAIGDINRFASDRRLVGYLGLDARVRQSGLTPARHGRISKQGSSAARHVLVEAAWAAIKTPGPLRAFYQRIRARRGSQIAIVAVARKLAVLSWHVLTKQQDYAFKRQTLVENKLRKIELRAGAPRRQGTHPTGPSARNRAEQERQLTQQAEQAYLRLVSDWKASRPAKTGAGAASGRASQRPSKGKAARQAPAPKPALSLAVTRTTPSIPPTPNQSRPNGT